jgi:2',3'-cyclic-nucleotide 2'-phosphodiesterase (5'-nucleotidase family)
MRKLVFHSFLLAAALILSCHSAYRSEQVQYTGYRIKNDGLTVPEIASAMKPYGDSINIKMNVVIGQNESRMDTRRQQNTLGYFITDAYLFMANRKSDKKVDAAFMNRGGIRLPELPPGAVTTWKIYELMPFDNMMLLVTIKGGLLKQYMDTLAATEGIIQSGMKVEVKNKKVQQILINSKPLDENADYLIAHSDYVVNSTPLLKKLHFQNTAYLLRNAIIDYVVDLNNKGKKITVSDTDRVIYAE